MFFQEGRIQAVREMILSEDLDARKKALAKLLPMQREDFIGLFRVMDGFPVTIRLLDPPLHEFLPTKDDQIQVLSQELKTSVEHLKMVISNLHEVNPMLGHRGCRLAITFPEIYEMQVEAIITAAIAAHQQGIQVIPEIEMPLIANAHEMKFLRDLTMRVIARFRDQIPFAYKIGAMLELPRACLTANQLAEHADFFSFGTNDLTQTTYGISRDDVGKFMNAYIEKGIFERDPSESIDVQGVGELMKTAVRLARERKPGIEIGICGEHGGEPASVAFCHDIGLDYVSCSPYRVIVARVAAAKANL
jgi:pyruvate,orthophosphate dikinase